MDRTDVCILINSTPKYYYILPFMIGMLRRYAPELKWPIFIATEEPVNPIFNGLNVKLISLAANQTGFLESRRAGMDEIVGQYRYCLPLQDDFILEKGIDWTAIQNILKAMDDDDDVVSARLMPCPGPLGNMGYKVKGWKYLSHESDTYGFVFQATLWKSYACFEWYNNICAALYKKIGLGNQNAGVEVRENIAENTEGQRLFWKMSRDLEYKHVAWARKGAWPNAVYLSPFPYRPTAIVRGKLEPWAEELMRRENF